MNSNQIWKDIAQERQEEIERLTTLIAHPEPTGDRMAALEAFDKGADCGGKNLNYPHLYNFKPSDVQLIRAALTAPVTDDQKGRGE